MIGTAKHEGNHVDMLRRFVMLVDDLTADGEALSLAELLAAQDDAHEQCMRQ